MSPTNIHVTSQLRQLIYYNLDNCLLRNAVFFASRLHGLEPRASEAAYLVSLCHLRLGQLKVAYQYAKHPGSRGTHLGCSYVFAQACLGLEKPAEGISALEKSKGLWSLKNNWNKHTESRRQHLPDAAAVLCLLGKLYETNAETHRAVESYAEALRLNPFMWDAFIGLCDLGVNVRIPKIFKMTSEMMSYAKAQDEALPSRMDDSPPLNVSQNPPTNISLSHDPFAVSHRMNGEPRITREKAPLFEKLNGSTTSITPLPFQQESHNVDGFETPTGPTATAARAKEREAQAHVLDDATTIEPPQAPFRKMRQIPSEHAPEAPQRPKSSLYRSTRVGPSGDSEDTEASTSTVISSSTTERKRTVSGQVAQVSGILARSKTLPSDPGGMAPQRRSVRLFNQIRPQSKYSATAGSIHINGKEGGRDLRKVKAVGTKGRTIHSTAGRVVSGNRRPGDPMDIDRKEARSIIPSGAPTTAIKAPFNEKSKEQEGLKVLLELFTKLGSGYFALSHFRCQEALQIFSSLPVSQRETPWVLAQMGRALYEQAQYADAERYFQRMRLLCPSRIDDVEIYSTVLWHLKSDVDLAHLAHEIIDTDRLSPQAWCAVGNSFSLQRDHDQALKCFRRATQLDPAFAYAFTLQGHEHVANEEYDKAMVAYRNGITADNRHYNAWYGLGKVFEKQGKYDFAEAHYRTAASINPTNAVLICCIGAVLEKMKRPQLALDQYTRSCELAPKSALSRFKKARVLMVLNLWEQALLELQLLKDIVPDEANVHFLLGRVYRTLRVKGEAIKHFTTALNLDPKASHHIKEAMEQIEDEDDEDDSSME